MSDAPQVIDHLHAWLRREEARLEGLEGVRYAQVWSLCEEIKSAIAKLDLCARYGISGHSQVLPIPDWRPSGLFPEFFVVCDHESSQKERWEELTQNGEEFRLGPGHRHQAMSPLSGFLPSAIA